MYRGGRMGVTLVNMREVSAMALRVAQAISAIAVIGACASMAMAHDEMQLQQLLNTKECAGCDLTNADLAKANLGSANLSHANVVNANLKWRKPEVRKFTWCQIEQRRSERRGLVLSQYQRGRGLGRPQRCEPHGRKSQRSKIEWCQPAGRRP